MCTVDIRARLGRLVVAASVAALIVGQVASGSAAGGALRPVRVMTLNMYIGADIGSALDPSLPASELGQALADIWQTVQASDFPGRAKSLAAEIRDADPQVLAIQEAALWRISEAGVADGPLTPATIVAYDFLALLRAELAAAGLPYRIAVDRVVFDAEVPTPLGHDVRLTESDAILVRDGLPADELAVVATDAHAFTRELVIPVGPVTITIRRGWVWADIVVNRRAARVVNTHLEPNVGILRPEQALELLGPRVAGGTTGPVVILGDLNSAPGDPAATNGYAVLTRAGLSDAWTVANGQVDGFTCCQDEALRNPISQLSRRIDHVLVRGATVVRAARFVVDPDGRTETGLWPSDHAAVGATLLP